MIVPSVGAIPVKSSISAYQNLSNPVQSSPSHAGKADTVEISEEGNARLKNARDQTHSAGKMSSGELPLEAFSLPGWLPELLTGYNEVDATIGMKYPDSRRAQYDSLDGTTKANLEAYETAVMEIFQGELKKNGIQSGQD